MSTKTNIQILQRGGVKRHDIIEHATRWGLSQLMSTRLANTLTIRIELRATKLRKGISGVAKSKAKGSKANKTFTIILLRDDCLKEQLVTLFHELVHVEQIAKNRLQKRVWRSDNRVHVRWEGKHLGPRDAIPYRTRPWEVEAFRLEKTLAKRYGNFLR